MTTKKKTAPKKATKKQSAEKITGFIPELEHVPFAIDRNTWVLIISPAGNSVKTTCGAIYDKLKPPFGTLEEGVNIVTNALRQDSELYETYKSNLAMVFYDECARRAPGFMIDLQIISTIANKAAVDFLEMWIGRTVTVKREFIKKVYAMNEPDPLEYASAIGQFREDHTGPALLNKFIKDCNDHVSTSELPSIISELIASFSARAIDNRNKLQDEYTMSAKKLEEAEVTTKKLQSIYNAKG